ncbi:ATP synthase subunit I [Bacillus altitudinis]|uniref:ATP synthase subunit I n=1 Tax=Bacillus altitudinis TaxID=293387 RepID=UPI00207AD52C|nr:ATP synthase subunit I [Bacillus altitudinis]USK24092.1 ATP synthase subunit I [Bacillus altitudinis]
MNDPNDIFRRQSKYMFYLLAIFVFGYAMPGFKPLFLGFIIGTIFAFFNLFLLIRRMHAFDRAVKKGKSIRSMGSTARWANAILAVAIAWRYPNEVHLAGVVIGLMTIYPVIMIDSFIQLKRSTMEER